MPVVVFMFMLFMHFVFFMFMLFMPFVFFMFFMLFVFFVFLLFVFLLMVLPMVLIMVMLLLLLLLLLLGFGGHSGHLDEVGHIVAVVGSRDYVFEGLMLFGSELLEDVGQQIFDVLRFAVARHHERVVLDRRVHLRLREVQHGVVVAEEVGFVHAQLLPSDFLYDRFDRFVAALLLRKPVPRFCSSL
jgi:hypothetical protein